MADVNQPRDHVPPFAQPFDRDGVGDGWISVRHRHEGHWWRFEVADKNGRLQLVHHAHRTGNAGGRPIEDLAIDAYDFATLEARRLGMVD
jgi:hypothetical protein